jgi:hypothetical protein
VADDATCLYCSVTFPIPFEHRALRDAERRTAEERAEAHAVYETLGRPPGVIARVWGSIAVGCIWLVVWPLAFVVDGLLIAKGLETLSRSMNATLYEVVPNSVIWTGIGVVLYATLAVPLAFGVYGNRRTNGRRRLQAALAALPPDRKGGPSRCRACGAPLDIGPGDLGLACIYCGADNLVRMPEAWVAGLRGKAERLDRHIESIGREDREMRQRERRSLRRQLAWPLVVIPIMAVFGFAFDNDTETYPPNYRTAIAGARQMIPAAQHTTGNYDRYIPPAITLDGSMFRMAFDKSEQHEGYSMRSYYVPLRAGETLELVAGDFPKGARALGFTFRTQASAVFGDDWRQAGSDVILYPNDTAAYVAPRSAWFRVDVMLVDDVAPGKQFAIGISVTPANS